MKKTILSILGFVSLSIASQETITLYEHKFFKDETYVGNIENGKLNGNGIVYNKDGDKVFEGTFKDNNVVNGTFFGNEVRFTDDIKYGFYKELIYNKNDKPFTNKTIKGNFPKPTGNIYTIFKDQDLDVNMDFYNTQSFSNLKGKLLVKKESLFVKGKLILTNNRIQEIETIFDFEDLEFTKENEIVIKGNDFRIEGTLGNSGHINNFTISNGVIIYNDDSKYYLNNMSFKYKDAIEKIDNFRKMATKPTKKETKEVEIPTYEKEKLVHTKKDIDINTNEIEYKNKNLYGNQPFTLDLEK